MIRVRHIEVRINEEWDETTSSDDSLCSTDLGCKVNIKMFDISEKVW